MKYTVVFEHVIERTVTCEVEASSTLEAIEKAKECDWIDSDEETAPEQGIETVNYRIVDA